MQVSLPEKGLEDKPLHDWRGLAQGPCTHTPSKQASKREGGPAFPLVELKKTL